MTLDFNVQPLTGAFAEYCARASMKEWGWHTINIEGKLPGAIERYQNRALQTEGIPRTWVSVFQDKAIGMVSILPQEHDDFEDLTPWLAALYVDDNHRRQGVATSLVKTAHEAAKEAGFSKIHLSVSDRGAVPLYKKLGYRTIGKINNPNPKIIKAVEHKKSRLMVAAL